MLLIYKLLFPVTSQLIGIYIVKIEEVKPKGQTEYEQDMWDNVNKILKWEKVGIQKTAIKILHVYKNWERDFGVLMK